MEEEKKQSVTLEDLAGMVKAGFDEIYKEFDEVHKQMGSMATTMATKDDLSREVGKLRSDMIDYIAQQNMQLKGDLIVLMRGEDKKLFSLVELLVEKNIISKADANRVTNIQPFPQMI